jgi:competence protein ComEC
VRIVAAIPASGLLAGCVLGLLLSDSPLIPLVTIAWLLLAICLAVAIVAWTRRQGHVLAISVAFGFCAGGVLLSSSAWQRAWRSPLRIAFEDLARGQRQEAEAEGRRLPEDDEAVATVEGVLRADASLTESGVSLSVDVDAIRGRVGQVGLVGRVGWEGQERQDRREGREEWHATRGGIAVTVVGSLAPQRLDDWRAGRRVRMPVALRRPSRYLDPGVPDHERALARRGTALVGTVKSGALVDLIARGNPVDELFGAVRAFARRAIADAVGCWNPQSGAIVAAIVIGDRAGLDARIERRLQEAGTYHVIAISGGNIAILAGVLVGLFRFGGLLGRTAMLSAIVLLGAYARFVGGGASVDRATLMAIVYFGARAFDQRSPPPNALAVVAGLLVGADPLAVVDSAFVLTFGATLAILHSQSVVAQSFSAASSGVAQGSSLPKSGVAQGFSPAIAFARPFVSMFAASVAAEVLLFPIIALVFSRVTFAGLALNFLAIPLMAAAQLAGMAVVPIALASPGAAALVGWVAHVGAAGLVWSADLVRYMPALSYRVAPPSWPAVVCYYAAVVCWWTLRRRRAAVGSDESALGGRTRRSSAAIAMVAALWILVDPRTLIAVRGDGRLHVTFIDVGQGDSIFVVFPHGSTLLVDAGGLAASSAFDVGDRVVAPVIRQAGFRRLNLAALTHGDPDHIGGASSIVSEFRPREVWEGIPVPRSEALAALRVLSQAAGARWVNVSAGARYIVDGVEILVQHPPPADWERQKVRNDDSLVLELRWRGVSILLTGDIGRVPERAIGRTLAPAPTRVVKIPHHGSLTSSAPEFVGAIHPTIAVVSAGRNNHFGHPVPEVLERYRVAGAQVFRTDRDGAVTIDTDGVSSSVRTFTGRDLSVR